MIKLRLQKIDVEDRMWMAASAWSNRHVIATQTTEGAFPVNVRTLGAHALSSVSLTYLLLFLWGWSNSFLSGPLGLNGIIPIQSSCVISYIFFWKWFISSLTFTLNHYIYLYNIIVTIIFPSMPTLVDTNQTVFLITNACQFSPDGRDSVSLFFFFYHYFYLNSFYDNFSLFLYLFEVDSRSSNTSLTHI